MSLTLHSERLTLTPYGLADTDIAIEIFTDPDVCRYAGHVSDDKEIRDNMHTRVRRGGNGCIGVWCIKIAGTGEKIGTVALLRFAFEDSPLHEVVATFDDNNYGSRNVLTKSGFTDRGRRRCYGTEGTYYRITREEWSSAQRSRP